MTKVSQYYDNLYSQSGHAFGGKSGQPINIVIDALKYISSGKVLDLGAGEGRNSLFLAEKGFDVKAIDISEAGINKLKERARKKGLKVETQILDLNEKDLEGSYDIVISSFITHHFKRVDVNQLFEKMKNHTSSRGLNLVASFTKDGDFFKDNPNTDRYYPDKDEIKNFYKDWEILEFCEKNTRARKTRADGRAMFNIASFLIAQKRK